MLCMKYVTCCTSQQTVTLGACDFLFLGIQKRTKEAVLVKEIRIDSPCTEKFTITLVWYAASLLQLFQILTLLLFIQSC